MSNTHTIPDRVDGSDAPNMERRSGPNRRPASSFKPGLCQFLLNFYGLLFVVLGLIALAGAAFLPASMIAVVGFGCLACGVPLLFISAMVSKRHKLTEDTYHERDPEAWATDGGDASIPSVDRGAHLSSTTAPADDPAPRYSSLEHFPEDGLPSYEAVIEGASPATTEDPS